MTSLSTAVEMTSHPVHVTTSAPLSFGISAILASSVSTGVTTTTATAPSHLSYGSALTAAAIAAAERAYISSAAAATVAAFHRAPSSSSSSSAAIAAASLWAAAAAAAAAQRHTVIPGVLTSSDRVTSTDCSASADTLMPPAAIFPWMQERKDRLSGWYIIIFITIIIIFLTLVKNEGRKKLS